MRLAELTLLVVCRGFTPALSTRQHALSVLREDNRLLRDSPQDFVKIADSITTCDSRVGVGTGPSANSKAAAIHVCLSDPACRAITRGDSNPPEEADQYYTCKEMSYNEHFKSAKNKDVLLKTAFLVANLGREDALVYPNAAIPTEYCAEFSDHDLSHASAEVVNWPTEQHQIGLQMTGEVTGGGTLLWSLKACNKGLNADTPPAQASDSVYVFLP